MQQQAETLATEGKQRTLYFHAIESFSTKQSIFTTELGAFKDTKVRNWVAEKAAQVLTDADKKTAEIPTQMFLPGMEDWVRAMPNHLARPFR